MMQLTVQAVQAGVVAGDRRSNRLRRHLQWCKHEPIRRERQNEKLHTVRIDVCSCDERGCFRRYDSTDRLRCGDRDGGTISARCKGWSRCWFDERRRRRRTERRCSGYDRLYSCEWCHRRWRWQGRSGWSRLRRRIGSRWDVLHGWRRRGFHFDRVQQIKIQIIHSVITEHIRRSRCNRGG